MSIKGEIEKTASYLRSARKAILGRGGEISPTAGLKDFPSAIYNIPADASLAFITDDAVAYRKVVPENASPYARVDRVGGMSYKTKNHISFPYKNNTTTLGGVTFTVNKDGTILVNGTATMLAQFIMVASADNKTISSGNYTLSGGISDNIFIRTPFGTDKGSGLKFTVSTETQWYINITVNAGATASNVLIKPMLNEGSTALPYEPYFEGIRSAKVTELVSHGKNLFNKDAENYHYSTANGIIVESNSYRAWFIDVRGLDTIRVSIIHPDTKGDIQVAIVSDTKLGTIAREKSRGVYRNSPYTTSLKSSNYEANYVCLTMWHTWLDELLPYIQVEAGSETTELAPYVGTIATKPIPEALRNFLEQYGYGLGINETYNNYIDYERKVFVQKCKEIDLSSLTFVLLSSTEQKVSFRAEIADLYKTSSQTEIPLLLCAQYKTVAQQGTWYVGDISQAHNTDMIYINEAPNTSLEEFTEKIKGVKLVYGLAEPIEIDISAYLTGDSFIEVQGGGTITAVNEYEYAVPSEINYIQRVGG